jgi:DNA-binding phage protein
MRTKSKKTSVKRRAARLEPHDPARTLRDPELVFRAFLDCLKEGDSRAAREVLAGGLRHMNKSQLSRRHGIPRRTLYNLLDRRSSPTLDLVAKVCRAIQAS